MTWRLLFLSTGEIGLAEHVASAGGRIRAGQEVRMLDIPSDGGCNLGVFENLHGAESARAFADDLQRVSETYYGTAAEALLNALTQSPEARDSAVAMVKACQTEFVSNYVPTSSHGQVLRAAARFGMVAGVGEYAISIGVLPWPAGEAIRGAKQCFDAWFDARGGGEASEELRALAQLRHFIELHGESRFPIIEGAVIGDFNNVGDKTILRAGYRKILDDDSTEYWVFREVFEDDMCRGFDYKLVACVLRKQGFLQVDPKGNYTVTKRLPGFPKPIRVYVIKPSLFDDEREAIPRAA
jgi:putative DNA primase/helicase